jgi:glycosyltransferase involved in cell wall biosynthesis
MARNPVAGVDALRELIRPYVRWLLLGLFPGQRPHYFSDCWRYPCHDVGPGRSANGQAAWEPGAAPDVLFLPMNDWHTRTQRSQQLAQAFAKLGHRSIYFNPHLGCEYLKPYLADRRSLFAFLGERLLEFHVHLPREHVFHRRMPTSSENARIVAAAGELAAALGIRQAIQIVSFPIWLETALALREAFGFPIVYDCHDHLGGFDNVAPEIVSAEPALFAASDVVAFSSGRLMETMVADFPEIGPKALLARNAVDADRFRRPAAPARAGRKTIGYVGALESWFDVEAVRTAACEHPDWRFLLAGRIVNSRLNALRACSNVTFAGEVSYARVPDLMAGFDLAMIPFLRNDLTLATDPIKLYEYFSLGLPVVSARLPEVELHGDLVYLADNPREFSAQVALAAAEDSPERRARRIAIAERESWTARTNQLLEAVRGLHIPRSSIEIAPNSAPQ